MQRIELCQQKESLSCFHNKASKRSLGTWNCKAPKQMVWMEDAKRRRWKVLKSHLTLLGGSVGSGERRVVCDKGVKCTRTVLSVELGPSSLPWRLTRDSRAVELTVKEESGFIGKGVGSVEGGEFDDWGMEELKMMGEKKRKMSSFVSHYL